MRRFRKKLPVILQKNQYDCGIACLAMVFSAIEKTKISINQIRNGKDIIGRDGANLLSLKKTAENLNYEAKVYRTYNLEDIKNLVREYPIIVHWNHNHFVVVESFNKDQISIVNPSSGRLIMSLEDFKTHYTGICMVLNRTDKAFSNDWKSMFKEENLIQKIGKYLFKDKKLIAYIIGFTFIFQLLNLATPFLTQYIIDSSLQGSYKFIAKDSLVLLVILSLFLFFSLSLVRMKFIITLQLRINRSLTEQVIKKIFSLPLKFFESNTVGDISTRIYNIAVIREVISRLASTLILDLSMLVVFFVVMLIYSPVLSLIVLIGACLQIVSTIYLLPRIELHTKQEVNSQSQFQSQFIEILRSVTFIKTLGKTDHMEQQLKNNFNQQLNYFEQRMNYSSLLGAISNSINLSLPLLILAIGIWSGSSTGLTLGALIAFSNIAGRFMSPLGSIISSMESIKMVEEMVDRIECIVNEKEEVLNKDSGSKFDPTQESIVLKHIDFSYNGTSNTLKDINLVITPKQKITLIGKTGSGKSTLFKLIAGLYEPSSGELYYGSQSIQSTDLVHLRETMGYIVQDVNLFNDTILNNIQYFNEKITMEAVIEAAQDACIHDEIMRMPMGYHTVIGENGMSLSGGQRQRIAIARVLAKQPKIIFIDEGTSNLDKATEFNILERIYTKEITVISITHRTEGLQFSDAVYELEQGQLKLIEQKNRQVL